MKLFSLIFGIITMFTSFVPSDGILFLIGALATAGGLIDVEIKNVERGEK
jgi:membrane protein DedA with SNARE-associated domain